ncbi:conserved protein, unknown function [Hepatocystis sp. ex Piliocolobus tephrosceles]|nr:conserved protein, unknown function [Hepatocystis sp. ex Piliocolobus tephrosceles]
MDEIKIVLSADLKVAKFYESLKLLLKHEEEKDKNDIKYLDMLKYENIKNVSENIKSIDSACFIYTNYIYKSHFSLAVDNEKQACRSIDCDKDNDFITFEKEINNSNNNNTKNRYDLSLILLIIDEDYLKHQHISHENNLIYKIKKLQEMYKNIRIICIFIGIRECLSRTDYHEEYSKIFKTNMNENENENLIYNNKHFDRFIAKLLIKYKVDTVEMENTISLHEYIFKCCKYLYQSKTKKLSSYFKVKPTSMLNQLKKLNINEIKNEEYLTWVSQLMQINGISEDISIKIADVFATPFDLIMHLKKVNNEEFLKDLVISSSYGQRKLGKALSRKIYKVFSPNAVPDNLVS